MNIALIPNLTRPDAAKISLEICKQLDSLGADYSFDPEFRKDFSCTGAGFIPVNDAVEECDAVIAVGGDGSIIHGAKLAAVRHKPILGVNAGRLAFMAGIENNELNLLSKLIEGDYELDKRLMLRTSVKRGDETVSFDYCVNDCYITNEEKQRMSAIGVSLNGRRFKEYLCDGIVAATPTGSTAYSLSAGGPVVDPELESILVTPVCPHSLMSRPMIFRPDSIIEVDAAEGQRICFSADGNEMQRIEKDERIEITAADMTADFIRIKSDNFINILYKKLAQRN